MVARDGQESKIKRKILNSKMCKWPHTVKHIIVVEVGWIDSFLFHLILKIYYDTIAHTYSGIVDRAQCLFSIIRNRDHTEANGNVSKVISFSTGCQKFAVISILQA